LEGIKDKRKLVFCGEQILALAVLSGQGSGWRPDVKIAFE
jgi:hypothetical protein